MTHKHADILIAIAEGKEIEFSYTTSEHDVVWQPIDDWINPISCENGEYRVKPQEKIVYVGCECVSSSGLTISNHIYSELEETEHWDNTLKFTISKDKIVSVELLENK